MDQYIDECVGLGMAICHLESRTQIIFPGGLKPEQVKEAIEAFYQNKREELGSHQIAFTNTEGAMLFVLVEDQTSLEEAFERLQATAEMFVESIKAVKAKWETRDKDVT
jgi:hypothetical protein